MPAGVCPICGIVVQDFPVAQPDCPVVALGVEQELRPGPPLEEELELEEEELLLEEELELEEEELLLDPPDELLLEEEPPTLRLPDRQ